MILLIVVLQGCALTDRKVEFTLVTSNQLDVSGLALGPRVKERDCEFQSLFEVREWPDMKQAINRALERERGDLLVDVDIQRSFLFLIVGVLVCDEVTGTIARMQLVHEHKGQ
jgi:hypothetical protein